MKTTKTYWSVQRVSGKGNRVHSFLSTFESYEEALEWCQQRIKEYPEGLFISKTYAKVETVTPPIEVTILS